LIDYLRDKIITRRMSKEYLYSLKKKYFLKKKVQVVIKEIKRLRLKADMKVEKETKLSIFWGCKRK